MNLVKNLIWSPIDYAEAAVLAKTVGEEMLARLEWMTLKPKVILDVGCGLGELSAGLATRYPEATIFALDSAESMLTVAKQHHVKPIFLTGLAEKLPLPAQSIDLLFANFLIPWHEDISALLQEWQRVLRPNGLLMLTALGLDTLREMQDWCENAELAPALIDMHDLGDLLLHEQFSDPVLDVDYYTLSYQSREKCLQELAASGMLMSQEKLIFSKPLEKWEATVEVIFAHAFMPEKTQIMNENGVTHIPLSQLRQQLKAR